MQKKKKIRWVFFQIYLSRMYVDYPRINIFRVKRHLRLHRSSRYSERSKNIPRCFGIQERACQSDVNVENEPKMRDDKAVKQAPSMAQVADFTRTSCTAFQSKSGRSRPYETVLPIKYSQICIVMALIVLVLQPSPAEPTTRRKIRSHLRHHATSATAPVAAQFAITVTSLSFLLRLPSTILNIFTPFLLPLSIPCLYLIRTPLRLKV